MMDIQIKGKKSKKVFKEYCEDCGCPLEVCYKPKEPVRLASESVDLKKLKEYRKSYIKDNQYIEGGLVSTILDDLIEWVEKEVKK